MRLALVMSHASRSMGGAMRELHLCAALRMRGVDARVWRMHPGQATEREEMLGVPLSFCPADDPAAHVHRQVSAALRAEIAAFADVVLYKGLGYAVNADVQAARPPGARYGLIVGGGVTDPLVPGAAVVFGEYREQLRHCFPDMLAAGRAAVLPKYLDFALAGDGVPSRKPDFDIVNVGTFAEPRKNQAALLAFATHHRIALVGAGPLMAEVKRAAHEAGVAERVTFFGRLPHARVFEVLRRSRLMVHTSTDDGLPRAMMEAMACGVPVVALRSTVMGGVPRNAGLLVQPEALPHAVEMILADDWLRRDMGRAARRHVEQHHGPAAIAAAAGQMYDAIFPK
jgi:glycosyltransferase involved in cell wall biosynthesis